MRTAVVVLGMHRSGTSAFARVANLLGCDLPKNLMLADEGNDLGHWESHSVTALNERLLASAGSKWDDWTPLNPKWEKSVVSPAFMAEAQQVLLDDYGKAPLFVLKDPRICRLTSFWLKAIEGIGAQAIVAFPIRNPYEVSSSLSTRDGSDQGFGLLLWLRHVLEAEAATRTLPRHFFTFERLLNDWSAVIDGLESTTNVRFPRRSVAVETEIASFLTEDARHEREANTNALNAASPQWVRDTYAILKRWCDDGVNQADFIRLDAIRAEFDAASPSFAQLIARGVETHRGYGSGAQMRAELALARQEVEQLQAIVENSDQDELMLEKAQNEVEQLRADVAQARAELERAREEVEYLQANANETGQVEATLEVVRSEMEQLQREGAQTQAALNAARIETERLKREEATAQQIRADLSNAHNIIEQLKAAAEATRIETERLEREEAAAQQIRAELSSAHNIIEQLQAAAEATRVETERLKREEATAQQIRAELSNACNTIQQMQLAAVQTRTETNNLQKEIVEREQARAILAQQLDDLNEANRHADGEIARLSSTVLQRQEEANQAWAKAEIEQRLREKAESEQTRLRLQTEDLIAKVCAIDERVRADASALASARRRASDAENVIGRMKREHETLIAAFETQGIELGQAQSRSARADHELAQLAVLHMHVRKQMHDLEEAAVRGDVYLSRIHQLEETVAQTSAYQEEIADLSQRVQTAEEAERRAQERLYHQQTETRAMQSMVSQEQKRTETMMSQAQWLQDAATVLQKKPRLRAILSSSAREQYSKDKLKASGLFDSDSYLEKNPDVAAAGIDPLLHYVRHGLFEGRSW